MANRALAAKVERAARERREAAHIEFSKSCYAGNATLADANARRAELAAMVAAFQGKIKRCLPSPRPVERVKGGFVADRSTISAATPVRAGAHYYTLDLARSTLIKG